MAGAFDRMSSRERLLVSTLLGLVLVLGVGGYYLILSSEVSDLQEKVDGARTKLSNIRKNLPKYRILRPFCQTWVTWST